MKRQPSLESRATAKKRRDRSASLASASVSAPSRTTSAKPPRSGELVVLPTPAEAPTSPLHPEYEYEEDEYDMNDEMSESLPSHVSVDSGSNDEDGSVDGGGGSPKSKRCKRKKGVQVSSKPKAKRGRGKTSKCWQHFTLTKVEGEPLPKAKCNYCGDLLLYKEGGQTSSMNRHNKLCQGYKDFLKGHIQGQSTLSFQPGGSSLASVSTEYNHGETRTIIAKMVLQDNYVDVHMEWNCGRPFAFDGRTILSIKTTAPENTRWIRCLLLQLMLYFLSI